MVTFVYLNGERRQCEHSNPKASRDKLLTHSNLLSNFMRNLAKPGRRFSRREMFVGPALDREIVSHIIYIFENFHIIGSTYRSVD
jgi:hypothetical protein